MSTGKKIAFFDFDGTITSKDSYLQFILFSHGALKTYLGFLVLSPWLVLWKLGLVSNSYVKQYSFWLFYRNWSEKRFKQICNRYADQIIPSFLLEDALNMMKLHLTKGHKVVLVSASIEAYLKPWTDKLGIELLGTRINIIEGYLIGSFEGKNCHGKEKERRIKEAYSLEEYDYIYAYGDSRGDKEMLQLASEAHFKLFK